MNLIIKFHHLGQIFLQNQPKRVSFISNLPYLDENG